jgi:hypothetical protein
VDGAGVAPELQAPSSTSIDAARAIVRFNRMGFSSFVLAVPIAGQRSG